MLEALPPVGKPSAFAFELAAVAAQTQEVVPCAEARMLEQPEGALSGSLLEARLQRPDLLDRRFEAAWDRQTSGLLFQHPIHRVEQRGHGALARALGGIPARQHFVPEQRREQEGRSYRLVFPHPRIGVGERQLDEPLPEWLLEDHVEQR